jgi:tetratricopeptide (TPR) repeat protein
MASHSVHSVSAVCRPICRRVSHWLLAALITSLCLGAAGTGRPATSAASTTAGGIANYQHAVECFNRGDYGAAAALLDKIPDNGNLKDRADILNLRGAIFLHQQHFVQAHACFTRARTLDPSLWAASFNQAEASFQEKDYAESRREFADLLVKTPSASRPEEYALVQYKALLAGLLAGNDKPVRAFLAQHANDTVSPVSYYFLNAALEYRQSHQREAGQWLTRASSAGVPLEEQVYAQTFTQLGWPTPHIDRAAYAEAQGGEASRSPAAFSAMSAQTGNAQKRSPATLAVVQLMPGQESSVKAPAEQPGAAPVEKPAFRYGGPMAIPLPSGQPEAEDNPPAPGDEIRTAPGVEGGMLASRLPDADVLARHKSTPTPSPSSSPDDSSSDSSGAQASPGGSASPGAADASAASPASSAAASPAASASPGSPAAPAKPEFMQKYEAAYVKFIQKDFDGAKTLLDEADALQPNQPSAISLRGQIFKHYYEAAYVAYLKAEYTGAMGQLDLADGVQPNQPDASNLRGLVFSRQHDYDKAEDMFKKAIQTDPTFWAAKFNLAELPFNYRNYTAARSRFEDLFAQTDPVKQPREAELTQFKVFLTLLLEGKEAGARSFMEHFTFSGTTPARYFCESALDFYHGDVDKAMGWLDSAKKEYPAQLVSIFIESFYRVGWMTDPSAHAAQLAAAGAGGGSPGASPSAAPSGSPAPAVAAASPAASPKVALAAAPTPGPAASAAASVAPVIAAGTPARVAPALVIAPGTPSSAFTPPPVAGIAAATPLPGRPTPQPTVALVQPSGTIAAAAASPVFAQASASPGASAAPAESAAPEITAATATSPAEETGAENPSSASEVARYLILIILVLQTVFVWTKVGRAFKVRNDRRAARLARYDAAKAVEPDEVEAPR